MFCLKSNKFYIFNDNLSILQEAFLIQTAFHTVVSYFFKPLEKQRACVVNFNNSYGLLTKPEVKMAGYWSSVCTFMDRGP